MNFSKIFELFETKADFQTFLTESHLDIRLKIFDGAVKLSIQSLEQSAAVHLRCVINHEEDNINYLLSTEDAFENFSLESNASLDGDIELSYQVIGKDFFSTITTPATYPGGVSLQGEVVSDFSNWPSIESKYSFSLDCGEYLNEIKEQLLPPFIENFSKGFMSAIKPEPDEFKLISSEETELENNGKRVEVSFIYDNTLGKLEIEMEFIENLLIASIRLSTEVVSI